MEYNFKEIESKWQNVWYTQNTFAAKQDFCRSSWQSRQHR